MAYAKDRKDPDYLKNYRSLLKEAHIYHLRGQGVPCACVACGVRVEDEPLGFLEADSERVSFKELLRQADTRKVLAACRRSPLACHRCRYNWRAGMRREFPKEPHISEYGNYSGAAD